MEDCLDVRLDPYDEKFELLAIYFPDVVPFMLLQGYKVVYGRKEMLVEERKLRKEIKCIKQRTTDLLLRLYTLGTTIFIIYGPPASLKSLIVNALKRYLGDKKVISLSTGAALRKEIKKETPLGRIVKKYVQGGKLVPDEVILRIVKRYFIGELEEAYVSGYKPEDIVIIGDGIIRTPYQAGKLLPLLEGDKYCILNLLPERGIKELSKGRAICENCGKAWNEANIQGTITLTRREKRTYPQDLLEKLRREKYDLPPYLPQTGKCECGVNIVKDGKVINVIRREDERNIDVRLKEFFRTFKGTFAGIKKHCKGIFTVIPNKGKRSVEEQARLIVKRVFKS